jgi:hypothetical protein
MDKTAALEIIEPRNPEGLGFYLKARATGRLFRVEPVRNPDQPRFWRLCIYRCERPRVLDRTERPWLSGHNLTREELPELLDTIRTDVDAWLDQDSCRALRRWLLAGTPTGGTEMSPDQMTAAAAAASATATAVTSATTNLS